MSHIAFWRGRKALKTKGFLCRLENLYLEQEDFIMEKVLWVTSVMKTLGAKGDDGLKEANDYLEKGWSVKHISACAMGENSVCGQAYIVIEKKD